MYFKTFLIYPILYHELNPNAFKHPKITLRIRRTVPKIVNRLATDFLHRLIFERFPNECEASLARHGISKSTTNAFITCCPSSLKHGTAFKTANALENATT